MCVYFDSHDSVTSFSFDDSRRILLLESPPNAGMPPRCEVRHYAREAELAIQSTQLRTKLAPFPPTTRV